jgi:hypothetical protein
MKIVSPAFNASRRRACPRYRNNDDPAETGASRPHFPRAIGAAAGH